MSVLEVGTDVAELVPDRLFSVSAAIPLDGRVSWVPASARGHQAANCFVLRNGASALILDPGAGAHEKVIMRGLEPVLAGVRSLSVFMTRAELDSMGNVGAIAERYPLEQVYAGIGGGNPFDAYDSGSLIDPKLRSTHADMRRVVDGYQVPIGEGRTFEVVLPAFRLLSTFWGYDSVAKALFTADLFSHQLLHRADDARVLDEPDPDTTLSVVRDHLHTKFWWTAHVDDVAPLKRSLTDVFDKFDVEIIAPHHGSVLRGKKMVTHHRDLLLAALG